MKSYFLILLTTLVALNRVNPYKQTLSSNNSSGNVFTAQIQTLNFTSKEIF